MNLIAYSDSEDSGDEAPSTVTINTKPAPKPIFQKVVDRSNPGRIKLNLPSLTQPKTQQNDVPGNAPPVKRQRTGGGAFTGFNAMLPAPKKRKVDAAIVATSASRGLGKGLGAGVSLKTGAEPAFKREPRLDLDEYDENGDPIKKEPLNKEDFRALLNLPAPKTEKMKTLSPAAIPTAPAATPAPVEAKPASRPKFMPLSVGRGKKTKAAVKIGSAKSQGDTLPPNASTAEQVPVAVKPSKPKVSLFSISHETESPSQAPASGIYQPLLHGVDQDDDDDDPDQDLHSTENLASHHPQVLPAAPATNLTNIASELKLSESERRQLFGRQGDWASAKIVEFNTDNEYAHNELLRQQGETVQHNALKSISGTGKNSLKSLVNVATSQKDALEDHFAQGRRNKKEAGNKYGW